MKWVLILFFTTYYRGEAPQLAIEFDTEGACQQVGEVLKARSEEKWGKERVAFLCLPKGTKQP